MWSLSGGVTMYYILLASLRVVVLRAMFVVLSCPFMFTSLFVFIFDCCRFYVCIVFYEFVCVCKLIIVVVCVVVLFTMLTKSGPLFLAMSAPIKIFLDDHMLVVQYKGDRSQIRKW